MSSKVTRRQFLTVAAATATAAATAAVALDVVVPGHKVVPALPAPPRPAPNIVMIAADDLGYGELGAYGQRLIQTPRMDELAAEGLRFTQAYSPAAVCAPSRCSLLTGLDAGHAAVRQNQFAGDPQRPLGDGDTTFGEVLLALGYRTGCVGKWGFGPEAAGQPSHPNARGFEEFFGYIDHAQAHDYFPDYLWQNGETLPLPAGTYAIDVLEERALAFIRAKAFGERPFLLYLTPNLPHAPSQIPESDPAFAAYADQPWNAANRGHAAQVTRLDRLVGSVVDELRALGIERQTLVLLTSDNGPHEEGGNDPDLFDANGPLRGYKRNLYEGGIRVPLIAWRPGTVAGGQTHERVTPLIDLLPTFADLAGAPIPPGIDGVSAAGLLGGRGPVADERGRPLYWYRNDPLSTPRANAEERGRLDRLAEALHRDDWKLIRYAPGRDRLAPDGTWDTELYHLATDPGERRNLAARHPELVAELTTLLRRSWTDPA